MRGRNKNGIKFVEMISVISKFLMTADKLSKLTIEIDKFAEFVSKFYHFLDFFKQKFCKLHQKFKVFNWNLKVLIPI